MWLDLPSPDCVEAFFDSIGPKEKCLGRTYFCVCAGAVGLGVVVTDIDTLP